ncbi:translation initiation factor IF-2 [Candidatus Woesearchaeota archaeon]|nr:translation initiation factor IF-2 [Candidatus Woesearchaeota archaeon]
MIRQPIVAMMGHVDHGKTSVLDQIRGSAIAAKEAGGITQAIGASIIPTETIKKVCGNLLEQLKLNLTIPGLLFIDTPGHAAFTSLRKRGGNLADMAILVIDIREGLKPQTVESIEILKSYKTPFIIAANKIDLISGYRPEKGSVLSTIAKQNDQVIHEIEKKLYEIVGQVAEHKIDSERFDRVDDYTKAVAIVPVSAKTGDGIPELLMVLAGLAQKYLEKTLKCDVKGEGKGTVLEVKDEKGMGKVMDVIIYGGSVSVGDSLVIGGLTSAVESRVKALFSPSALSEMRDKHARFKSIKEVSASTGVRIVAPGIDDVVSGMPLIAGTDDTEKAKKEVQEQVEEVLVETDEQGIVIKADSLGSLEALSNLLREKNISIKKASVGPISKRDLSDAEANFDKNPLIAVVLGFNLQLPDAVPDKVKVICHDVIYKLIEDLEKWQENTKKQIELKALSLLSKPCKIQLLKGYTFRQSNPAVIGADVLSGTLTTGVSLMNKEAKVLTTVKGIQEEQKSLSEAEKGKRIAVSLSGVIIGRQVKEGDILYSLIPEEDFRNFKKYKEFLSSDEKELLKEIAVIMRLKNPVWGV